MIVALPCLKTFLPSTRIGRLMNDIDLKQYIESFPDFPKPGILFYDIGSLMRNADAWQLATARMAHAVAPWQPDQLAAIESRGFLTAAPLATRLGAGIIMLRKPGKLAGETISHSYDLEYGSDTLHIQAGAIQPGQRVVVTDDMLATGGTLAASIALLRKAGANVVGASVLMELTALRGREKIDVPVHALLSYDD